MNRGIPFLFLLGIGPLIAGDGVCQKCVRIREENVRRAETEKKYDYFEDWLDDNPEGSQPPKAEIDFGDTSKDPSLES